jgi:hypothetical protein
VTEALLLNNSDRVMKELLRDAGDSLVGKLKAMDDRNAAIETATWSIFNRSPDEEEAEAFSQFLDERSDRPVEAYQQLVWALLTSSECRFNY